VNSSVPHCGGIKVPAIKIRTIRDRRTIVSVMEEKKDHRRFLFFDKKKAPYLLTNLIKNTIENISCQRKSKI